MGATKRICELYLAAMNDHRGGRRGQSVATRFVVVRFGNVLGSAGSVVPLFTRQIENGDPLTITDPDVSRFFMTIPEAVGLVLQSPTSRRRWRRVRPRHGKPVKISQLADDLVASLGLAPADVSRRFVGLRPGEKLHEVLWQDDEEVLRSPGSRIFSVRQTRLPVRVVRDLVGELERRAIRGDVRALLSLVHEVIPSYTPPADTREFAVSEAGEKYRLLVVDDEAMSRQLLREILEERYDVETAETAAEGLEVARLRVPHLVVLDVNLPDGSGIELCRTLRSDPETAAMRVILVTGYSADGSAVVGLQAEPTTMSPSRSVSTNSWRASRRSCDDRFQTRRMPPEPRHSRIGNSVRRKKTMGWQVPVAHPDLGEAEAEAVAAVVRSGWISQGPRVRDLEDAFRKLTGAPHAVATCNGTAALHTVLLALGLGRGDQVITSPLSCIASVNPILFQGAEPIFVDIEPGTYNLDPAQVEGRITARTRLILPVHLFGHPVDMDPILEIGRRRGVAIVEDACQAIGARYRNSPVGSLGLAGYFSMYTNKTVTAGEGGMVVTGDAELYRRMQAIRNLGQLPGEHFVHPLLGANYKMTDLQAAIGIVQMPSSPRPSPDAVTTSPRSTAPWRGSRT